MNTALIARLWILGPVWGVERLHLIVTKDEADGGCDAIGKIDRQAHQRSSHSTGLSLEVSSSVFLMPEAG